MFYLTEWILCDLVALGTVSYTCKPPWLALYHGLCYVLCAVTTNQEQGMTPDTTIMNINEAAKYLKCSVSFIRKLVAAGTIPHHRLGHDLRFVACELLGWLTGKEIMMPFAAWIRAETAPEPATEAPTTPRATTAPAKAGKGKGRGKGRRLTPAMVVTAQAAFLQARREGVTVGEAAKVAGVAIATIYRWFNDDPVFKAQSDAIFNDDAVPMTPTAPAAPATAPGELRQPLLY